MGKARTAYWHKGQPLGHVGSNDVGVWHTGPEDGPGPWTSQQSCPLPQQVEPQQKVPGVHVFGPAQGTGMHWPLEQNGFGPGHVEPHVPQFVGSLPEYTHVAPQHEKGCAQLVGSHPVEPPLPAVPPVPPSQCHTASPPQLQLCPLGPGVAQPLPG